MHTKLVEALNLWVELTGIDPEKDRWTQSRHDWNIERINNDLKESLTLEPTGMLTATMLDNYVQWFLSDRQISYLEIMENYDSFQEFLTNCYRITSVLKDQGFLDLRAANEAMVLAAMKHYGIENSETVEAAKNPYALAFLLRDALKSVNQLVTRQFTQGAPDPNAPQVFKNVLVFWSINDFIKALTASPISGVAMCMIRHNDPRKNYFCWGVKNGATITLLTDRPDYVHPEQYQMWTGRSKDGRFLDRAYQHHFPYDELVNFKWNEELKFLQFEQETALAAYVADASYYRTKTINDLSPDQAIWAILMLGLIKDRFYDQNLQLPQLSYTGEMVRVKALGPGGVINRSLALVNYKELEVTPFTKQDVVTPAMLHDWERPTSRNNLWMEERYGHMVPDHVLNLVGDGEGQGYYLPYPAAHPAPSTTETALTVASLLPITTAPDISDLGSWQGNEKEGRIRSYKLASVDTSLMGTAAEIEKHRRWVARRNYAKIINHLAWREFGERRTEIVLWYKKQVQGNRNAILEAIAHGTLAAETIVSGRHRRGREVQNILECIEKDNPPSHMASWETIGHEDEKDETAEVNFSPYWLSTGSRYACCINGGRGDLLVRIRPTTAHGLATLCGCAVEELPDVLQHWTRENEFGTANPKLDNADPLDWAVSNPWRELKYTVYVHLSKSGYLEICKKHGVKSNRFWLANKDPK